MRRPALEPGLVRRATVTLKKIIVWLVVTMAVPYVIQFPDSAAPVVRGAGNGLADAGSSLVSFLGSLI